MSHVSFVVHDLFKRNSNGFNKRRTNVFFFQVSSHILIFKQKRFSLESDASCSMAKKETNNFKSCIKEVVFFLEVLSLLTKT